MYGFFQVFVSQPLLALLPAAIFALTGWLTREKIAWFAAAAWGFYALFELGNKVRITCSGECNIRIDLLVICPALLALSALALILIGLRRRGSRR